MAQDNKILKPKGGWNNVNKFFMKKTELMKEEDEAQSVNCIDWHMHYYSFLINKVTLLESGKSNEEK